MEIEIVANKLQDGCEMLPLAMRSHSAEPGQSHKFSQSLEVHTVFVVFGALEADFIDRDER